MKQLLLLFFLSGCMLPARDRNYFEKLPLELTERQTFLDISYGSDSLQKLDVYLPGMRSKNTTTIFYVHGGGWNEGDKSESKKWATWFQDKGYAFVSIDYRLVDRKKNTTYETPILDIDAAIDFINRNGRLLGVSRTQNAIMGASAGGHLALLYAYKYNKHKKIKAAVSFCGITDLTDEQFIATSAGPFNMGQMITRYVGDTITMRPELWKLASPINYISINSVPTFFLHGKKDELIPYAQSTKAFDALQAFNIKGELDLLENTGHGILSLDLKNELLKVDLFLQANIP